MKKTLDEMMFGMGFSTEDTGPNVTKFRAIVSRQMDNGMIHHSAGTWAPEHGPAGMRLSSEDRAAAFIEIQEAIDEGRFIKLDYVGSYRENPS